jgi:hypothetical protein
LRRSGRLFRWGSTGYARTLRGGGVDEGVGLEDTDAEEKGMGSTDDDDGDEDIELEDSDTEEEADNEDGTGLALPSRKRKRDPRDPHPGRACKRTTAAMKGILASAAALHTRYVKMMFLRRWLWCSAGCLASGCDPSLGAEEDGERADVPLLRWKLEE